MKLPAKLPRTGELPEPVQSCTGRFNRALCKKETLFTWESSQLAAFEAIKKEITNAPVLAYFDGTTLL